MPKPKIIVVCGPPKTGKTRTARTYNAPIVTVEKLPEAFASDLQVSGAIKTRASALFAEGHKLVVVDDIARRPRLHLEDDAWDVETIELRYVAHITRL